jgi:hypothetical protein
MGPEMKMRPEMCALTDKASIAVIHQLSFKSHPILSKWYGKRKIHLLVGLFTVSVAGIVSSVSVSTPPFALGHTLTIQFPFYYVGKDLVIESDGGAQSTIQRQTHLLRPNSRHPDPRALGTVDTPTATDLETSVIETDGSEVGDLADSLSSLHVIGAAEAAQARNSLEAVAEGEADFSDAESAFSFIEHPSMTESAGVKKNMITSTDTNTDEDLATNMKHSLDLEIREEGREQRPARTLERVEEVARPGGIVRSGSGSSPSRSPRRRPRRVRRIIAPRRSQGVFRSVDPPTTFMAYVYGA